jgi:RING finger protein 170
MVGLLDELVGLFTGVEGSGNVAIGLRNGGLELVCSICSNIPIVSEKVLVSALKTLALLTHGMCFFLYRMMPFALLNGWFMDLEFGG